MCVLFTLNLRVSLSNQQLLKWVSPKFKHADDSQHLSNLVQQCFISSSADSEESSYSFQFDFSVVIWLSNFYLLCFKRGRDVNSTIKTVATILEESQKVIEKSE